MLEQQAAFQRPGCAVRRLRVRHLLTERSLQECLHPVTFSASHSMLFKMTEVEVKPQFPWQWGPFPCSFAQASRACSLPWHHMISEHTKDSRAHVRILCTILTFKIEPPLEHESCFMVRPCRHYARFPGFFAGLFVVFPTIFHLLVRPSPNNYSICGPIMSISTGNATVQGPCRRMAYSLPEVWPATSLLQCVGLWERMESLWAQGGPAPLLCVPMQFQALYCSSCIDCSACCKLRQSHAMQC